MLEFLKDNWMSIGGVIGAVVVWFSEWTKRKHEGRVGLNDATEGMQNMYDKFVNDANIQYDKLNEKIFKLQESERLAIDERNALSETLKTIQRQMNNDKGKIRELEKKIAGYEETIKTYELKISDYELQVKNLKEELKKHK